MTSRHIASDYTPLPPPALPHLPHLLPFFFLFRVAVLLCTCLLLAPSDPSHSLFDHPSIRPPCILPHTSPTAAQIFTFSATPIPKIPSPIVAKDRFFVFGANDTRRSFLWLPQYTPSVTFENIRLSSGTADGVQITLVGDRYWKQYFMHLGSPVEMCCPPSFSPLSTEGGKDGGDVSGGDGDGKKEADGGSDQEDQGMCPDPYRLAWPSKCVAVYDVLNVERNVSEEPRVLHETDTYLLLLSNCGESQKDGVLEGRVVVRNAYGYLPGLEFPKMVFYFWLMLGYLGVLIMWSVMLWWHWKRAIHFHYCIEGVIVFSLLECIIQFAYYAVWNSSGSRNSALLVMSILTTVLKNIFSYMLVLVASLGWGVTKPSLERPVIFRIQAVVLLYVVLDSIRQVTDEFIYSPNLPVTQFLLVVICLIPISVLNGIIFYWVFSSLTDLLEVLEEQKQFEKLQIFKRLLAVLVATLVLFTIALFVQIYAAASDVTERWQIHWWLSDGVPHLLFMLVLIVMMCLWKPNEHSRKLAYFHELPDEDELDDTPKLGVSDLTTHAV
eukprot:GHVQ01022233.1.p1 GENE.GHVQ01022233.1~~GHVQ01022233.1.p1  ORF type:complete len:552 (+),score=57.60 GHVQ01022233.1:390-2045(+)